MKRVEKKQAKNPQHPQGASSNAGAQAKATKDYKNLLERVTALMEVLEGCLSDVAFGLTREERIEKVRKRPERYRKGVVETVWKNAENSKGIVRDPNTLEELKWDRTKSRHGQWDMGHKYGYSYNDLKQEFIEGEISYQQYLDEYNNPDNYHPESMSSNRSRIYD